MGATVRSDGNILRDSRSGPCPVSSAAFPVVCPNLQRFLGSAGSHPDVLPRNSFHNGAGPGEFRSHAGVLLPIPNRRSFLLVLFGSAGTDRFQRETLPAYRRGCPTALSCRISARSKSRASSDPRGTVAWVPTQRGSSSPADRCR